MRYLSRLVEYHTTLNVTFILCQSGYSQKFYNWRFVSNEVLSLRIRELLGYHSIYSDEPSDIFLISENIE
jgi:hypothetical protein